MNVTCVETNGPPTTRRFCRGGKPTASFPSGEPPSRVIVKLISSWTPILRASTSERTVRSSAPRRLPRPQTIAALSVQERTARTTSPSLCERAGALGQQAPLRSFRSVARRRGLLALLRHALSSRAFLPFPPRSWGSLGLGLADPWLASCRGCSSDFASWRFCRTALWNPGLWDLPLLLLLLLVFILLLLLLPAVVLAARGTQGHLRLWRASPSSGASAARRGRRAPHPRSPSSRTAHSRG